MPSSALARVWPASVAFFPRGPGPGEIAVAHKGDPPLLSGGELGGWSRGAWLLAPQARWRRRRVGRCWRAVDHRRPRPRCRGGALDGCALPLSPWPHRGPAIGRGMQRGPATWCFKMWKGRRQLGWALLGVRPSVIWGLPTGRDFELRAGFKGTYESNRGPRLGECKYKKPLALFLFCLVRPLFGFLERPHCELKTRA